MGTAYRNRLATKVSAVASSGLGAFTISTAVPGYRTFTSIENGESFSITIVEGSNWEVRTGCVYTHSTKTLTRGTLESSKDGVPIAFTNSCTLINSPAASFFNKNIIESFIVPISDQTTALTTGTSVMTWRMPYAFTLTEVRVSVNTAQTAGSTLTFDIKKNGASILSTKLTINNNDKTSVTATIPAVISDSAIASDAELTFDIVTVGTAGAKGAVITLIGNQ
jgi:hypothetical protein